MRAACPGIQAGSPARCAGLNDTCVLNMDSSAFRLRNFLVACGRAAYEVHPAAHGTNSIGAACRLRDDRRPVVRLREYTDAPCGFQATSPASDPRSVTSGGRRRNVSALSNGSVKRDGSATRVLSQVSPFWTLKRLILETSVVGLIRKSAAAPSAP